MKTGYLVPPRDPEALAKGIDYLIDNPGVRRKMGKEARRRVLATFTWENAAREMVNVYEEVIRAHRGL
jgi:glycosyltransferase involved in cell wall biosynthesis